jgi:hypothetical protein
MTEEAREQLLLVMVEKVVAEEARAQARWWAEMARLELASTQPKVATGTKYPRTHGHQTRWTRI